MLERRVCSGPGCRMWDSRDTAPPLAVGNNTSGSRQNRGKGELNQVDLGSITRITKIGMSPLPKLGLAWPRKPLLVLLRTNTGVTSSAHHAHTRGRLIAMATVQCNLIVAIYAPRNAPSPRQEGLSARSLNATLGKGVMNQPFAKLHHSWTIPHRQVQSRGLRRNLISNKLDRCCRTSGGCAHDSGVSRVFVSLVTTVTERAAACMPASTSSASTPIVEAEPIKGRAVQ
jgi:hypothetical protein